MPTVWIPALLRPLVQGHETLQVAGQTMLEVVDALEGKFPGIKARLCTDGQLRPGMAVVIDSQVAREGLSAAVEENSEVHFIPAIAGGGSASLVV